MRLSVGLTGRRCILTVSTMSMFVISGCATYRPIDRNAAGALTEARVVLNERGTLELAPRIGPNAASLDGHLRNTTDTTIVIALTQIVTRGGDSQQWSGEALTVPLSWISGYRQRTSSAKKTSFLVGAIVAAVAAIGAAFAAGNSGSGGTNQNGGTPK